jgi:uncharacterized protein
MSLATRTYTDLDLDFAAHPVTRDITKKKGSAAVITAMKNLLQTNFYEKPFQPSIGSNLRRLLFENISPLTASELRTEVELVIRNFEPRVSLDRVIISPNEEQQRYDITIVFFIVNQAEPIQVNLFLERVR